MDLMKNTKKQLVVLLEGHKHRLDAIRHSAGTLRREIYSLDLDPEVRDAIIQKIDKHINKL